MRFFLSVILIFTSATSIAELKLSEVLYDTPGTDSIEEWVEFYNSGCESINLDEYSIADNSGSFTLSGSISPGSYFIVARDNDGFRNLYGQSPDQDGLTLSLGNTGDYIALYEGASLVDMVAWEGEISGWNLSAKYVSLYRDTISTSSTESDWANSNSDSPGTGNLNQSCEGSPPTDDDNQDEDVNYEGNYYNSVLSLNGSSLKNGLQNLLEGDHIRLSYAEVWDALQDTDEDPNNPNNVLLLYTGRSHDKDDRDGQVGYDNESWNREHVWPSSLGFSSSGQYGYTDIHHIRPADKTVNSSRGNKDFDEGGNSHSEAANTYTDTDSWEPRDDIKGDIARMIFYMDVRYDGSDGNMDDLYLVNNTLSESGDSFIGVVCTLYNWHHEDPIDSTEMRRNNRIESWQGNRNPFIDHPEWVEELYTDQCGEY